MATSFDPQVWAAAAAIILTALGGFVSVLLQQSKTHAKQDEAVEKQAEVHRMVNSNMSRMFMALGLAFGCIAGLVWYGLSESGKRRE